MKYISTRGNAPVLNFEDVLLAGLAIDGGLYVPETWPQFTTQQLEQMADKSYVDVAHQVLKPFVDDSLSDNELGDILVSSYDCFNHKSVAPLVELGQNDWLMELYHGPTLAFKDVAMQFLSRTMDHVLAKRDKRVTIVGATSGDTGAAAVEAFKGRSNIDVFILHPLGRVSDVQRRQMTTVLDDNIFNIAVRGNFDDCQNILKDLFKDIELREKISLAGVNSINWARVVAQSVYYFTTSMALGAPQRKISYSVPTGNFGDVYAGYIAKNMGLPIDKLIVATNINDILVRTLETGTYSLGGVTATQSPSMDIQVASNFERFLFQAGTPADGIIKIMSELNEKGKFDLDPDVWSKFKQIFAAARASEQETQDTISKILDDTSIIIDPHTAVGISAGQQIRKKHDINNSTPLVHLATAHPAKFPDAVEKAIDKKVGLPARMADLFDREEKLEVLDADTSTIKTYIESKVGGR